MYFFTVDLINNVLSTPFRFEFAFVLVLVFIHHCFYSFFMLLSTTSCGSQLANMIKVYIFVGIQEQVLQLNSFISPRFQFQLFLYYYSAKTFQFQSKNFFYSNCNLTQKWSHASKSKSICDKISNGCVVSTLSTLCLSHFKMISSRRIWKKKSISKIVHLKRQEIQCDSFKAFYWDSCI